MATPSSKAPGETRFPANSLYIMSLFARARVAPAGAAGGVCGCLILFLATAVLVIRGAPDGEEIGPNLRALATFLPGYSVTWPGAFIGGGYAAIIGAGCAMTVSLFWNLAHIVVMAAILFKNNGE